LAIFTAVPGAAQTSTIRPAVTKIDPVKLGGGPAKQRLGSPIIGMTDFFRVKVYLTGNGTVRINDYECKPLPSLAQRICNTLVPKKSVVKFEAIAPEGFTFTGWSKGFDCDYLPTCEKIANTDLSQGAFFKKTTEKVKFSVFVMQGGKVVQVNGGLNPIDCQFKSGYKSLQSGVCESEALDGSMVTLKAIPDKSSKFDQWFLFSGPGHPCAANPTCTFKIQKTPGFFNELRARFE